MLTVRYRTLAVERGDTLLDLGCGAGRHTYEAMRLGARVVSADLDLGVLKEVRDVAAAVAIDASLEPPVGCLGADALSLPFADGEFDRIIVSEVLEHIHDDRTALTEIARVLRPGGIVALTVPRFWPERLCWMLSDEYHANEGGHVRIYRRSELIRRSEAAGLEPFEIHHAHALHVPYWWLKCAVGVRDDDHPIPRAYHRFLVWDIERAPRLTRWIERGLDPIAGKSLVLYARKASA